jgi:hypothetical protein
MELLDQQIKAVNFSDALIQSIQPVEGDVELELELKAATDSGSSRGRLVFVTAYVIESDSLDTVRLKMDRVYFKKAVSPAGGKILRLSFLFEEDEKQAKITFIKYGSSGIEEERFALTIKCLAIKWLT